VTGGVVASGDLLEAPGDHHGDGLDDVDAGELAVALAEIPSRNPNYSGRFSGLNRTIH
jgi:hypothetical protein